MGNPTMNTRAIDAHSMDRPGPDIRVEGIRFGFGSVHPHKRIFGLCLLMSACNATLPHTAGQFSTVLCIKSLMCTTHQALRYFAWIVGNQGDSTGGESW